MVLSYCCIAMKSLHTNQWRSNLSARDYSVEYPYLLLRCIALLKISLVNADLYVVYYHIQLVFNYFFTSVCSIAVLPKCFGKSSLGQHLKPRRQVIWYCSIASILILLILLCCLYRRIVCIAVWAVLRIATMQHCTYC
jgi:hypothetical protein